MADIRIGNAPCSWGTLEFAELAGERIGYAQVLDEMRDAGYTGTELGDWGFMPTDPPALRAALHQRRLALTGAFLPVALKDAAAHADGKARALKLARLLAAAGPADAPPFLVLSDLNGTNHIRTQAAGRIMPRMELSQDEWRVFVSGAERIAGAVREETGIRTVFHPHCAGFVETPREIDRLLELTDPDLLGLVFDTGHYQYGTGGNNSGAVRHGLERFTERIWYVQCKDCHPEIAAQARTQAWDYFAAVRAGVFCELGQGCVDFPAVVEWLRANSYRGWITVEQDVLPGMGAPKASAQRNRAYLRTLGL